MRYQEAAGPLPRREYQEGLSTMKITTEEAFVKVLQRHGIEHVFGIIGSAFMPISDLFPGRRHHVLGLRP